MSRKVILLAMLSIAVVLLVKFTVTDSAQFLAPYHRWSAQYSAKNSVSVSQLSQLSYVSHWLKTHQQLPDYYIRKGEARRLGWQPQRNNLCTVLPGKVIGGDHFANREARLPQRPGIQWFEADVNYQCGHRNGQRLVYSNDGQQFLTSDHYRTFKALP